MGALAGLFSFAGACAFFVPLGYQCFAFLSAGRWPKLSMIDAVLKVYRPEATDAWLYFPQSWIGVHKIMDSVPAFIGLPVALFGLACLLVVLDDTAQQAKAT